MTTRKCKAEKTNGKPSGSIVQETPKEPFVLHIGGNGVSAQQGVNDSMYNAGALFGWLHACSCSNSRFEPVAEDFSHVTFEHPSVHLQEPRHGMGTVSLAREGQSGPCLRVARADYGCQAATGQ